VIAAAAVAVPFAAAGLVGLLRAVGARAGSATGVALTATVVSGLLVGSLWFVEPGPTVWRLEWISGLGIGFGFWVDGLSRAFAGLVASLAFVTVLYSSGYLEVSREGRGESSDEAYYAYLLLLAGSSLGLAFSADLIQLYLFWEMIDVAVFLLVGLAWREGPARRSAGIVLLFTALGGLVLLGGIVLLGMAAGSFSIPELLAGAGGAPSAPYFVLALVLFIVGAAIKSAQFPFHVWLPQAMRAPTPVNAFADGAAALAAGVFVLLRVEPVASGDPLWSGLLVAAGLGSALAGGVLALRAVDLKVLLAFSTVSQYGFMVAFVGFAGDAARLPAAFFLVQHGLLKAGLFFLIGMVGCGAGAWRIGSAPPRLWRALPIPCAVAALLALSLAGLPPLGGFWMKELFLGEAAASLAPWLVGIAVIAAALTVVYMLRLFGAVFLADGDGEPTIRRVPVRLVVVPGVLAIGTVLFGLRPELLERLLLDAGAPAAAVEPLNLTIHLGPAFLLSAAALGFGLVAHLTRRHWRSRLGWRGSLTGGYERLGDRITRLGRRVLDLQNGLLLRYLMVTFLGVFALLGSILIAPGDWPPFTASAVEAEVAGTMDWRAAPLLLLVCAGSLMTFFLRAHVPMVLALGAVGYLLAAVFALAHAPSLGLLQVHVETLVTVMLVLPLVRIPREVRERLFGAVRERVTTARLAVAVTAGGAGAWASWLAIEHLPAQPVAEWIGESGQELTGAEDLVAAVLLHVRALDTLGEIVVFATATAGVLAIAHLIREERR
jgi:NADH:ubiquinone oxidoreductase subunit 5 (subunit L)/multisubunit Na+/H+ antiporter MnhA subunit/multisubunit Na+/H+ antiporter MnhB subunit